MLNVTVLVSGGGTNLQAIIDAVSGGRITNTRIGAVISSSREAYALKRADSAGIPQEVLRPKNYDDESAFASALLTVLAGYDTDLIVLAGYLTVIPPEVVAEYENRIINVHPSLIPSFCGKGYYGLKVHEEVLKRGCKVTGATVHFVDEGTDTGPIILQKAVNVESGDTPKDLQQRVMEEAEWKLLPRAIDLIANGRVSVEDGIVKLTDDDELTHAPGTSEDTQDAEFHGNAD